MNHTLEELTWAIQQRAYHKRNHLKKMSECSENCKQALKIVNDDNEAKKA